MKRKKIFFLVLFISLIVFSGIIIIASSITSAKGELEVTNSNITIESSSALDTSTSSDWVYKKAGDKKLINVTLTNSSVENIHRYYQLSLNKDIDTTLKSAILVYYNGEFVNTLSELVLNTNTYIDVPTSMTKTNSTSTDSFTFELHQAASNSIFNSKEISINISVFAENIDYERYALVSNDSEFVKVIDDINSGLLDNIPTIVLANPITLSSSVTIKEPITIETNGNGITGSITINDDNTDDPNALVRIEGNGSINSITLGDYYDKNGALDLIVEHASNQLKYGLQADSDNPQKIDIISPYSFYSGITISNSGDASYNAGTLTASKNIEFTKLAALTISNTTKTEIINYKHIGIKSAFGESEVLNHLPNNEKIITNDLFLPTFIPSYNASIEWKSSNTSIISNDGKIVKDKCDGESITLTATIKINNRTYTRVFKFKVTSNNNMVNFQKLVKDISPLIIKKKYSNSDAANTTYYLPIVTEYNTSNKSFGNYDYRKDYTSPLTAPTFNWTAHEDIGLKSLTYSLYDSELYYYIGLTDTSPNNGVMLIQDTLSNYAKINISGEFNNGEICEGIINISISLGSDTELLEKAFNHINNELDDISILGNIIVTRLSDGILNEKGDFSLPSTYDEDYIISYNLLSENTGLKISIDEENSCYHFAVDPTKFTSVETAVPVQAKVEYTKSSGTKISKTKIIYVTLPAALHISDLGNISIFNSLKYQVINALPTNEINNNTGFTTSNGIVSYSGYDYILLRDIVGDIEYINNYSFDGNYLKDTGYKLDDFNGATGVTSITLVNSSTNNTSTTDTLAYDFIKLIQWATGDTKVTAASILSEAGKGKISSLNGYTSNGETYLTENELAVIEAFYKACTNDNDGTKWSEIKSKVLETAPGRIYDNATLLETILNCLTTEKGINSGWYENYSNGTYGKIYAKYLEIVNRYATTTSENEEHMAPAQEVYNSKFYYSFTSTAANSTTSGTAAISIPCKYYDAKGDLVSGYCNRYPLPTSGDFAYTGSGSNKRHGVYAAKKKFDDPNVNIYANKEGFPYDSDKTKYITSAELMVLKAFWLGALAGAQNANTDSSNGVLHTFSIESSTKITNALKADENGILPYPNYTSNDFQCYGQAILNAFDACLTIPTTFTSNGIGLLINSFYDNYNSTGYKVRVYGKADDTTFESVLVSSVPAVTNLDNIEGALSYFSKLTSINIIGKENIAIYLSDYGLSTSFARICLTNKSITSLNMQYVSSNWNDFDITNIKHLNNLTEINISNNLGIKSVYPLLNVNRSKYTSVNFSNIGEVYEYNEFAIDNLASDNCTVHYTDENGAPASKNEGNPSTLVNLSDIEDLVSEHLYLTNVIYDESNTNICWRIEEGNEINEDEINQGGELDKINSVNAMNMRLSPYFYCNSDFDYDNYKFKTNHIYKITYNQGSIIVEDVNGDGYTVNLVSQNSDLEKRVLDINGNIIDENLGEEVNIQNNDEFDRISEVYSDKSKTVYVQDFKDENNITYTISMYYQVFSFQAYNEFLYDGQDGGGTKTYYLMANGSELRARYMENLDSSCYMVILTPQQAEFINFLNKNSNEVSDTDMASYNIVPDSNTKVLTLGIQNLTANVDECYIYNVKEKKFMYSGGFDTKLGNKFKITKSNNYFRIFNSTANKYLDCFKQLIYSNDKGSNVISAVFNTKDVKTDNLTSPKTNHQKLYNSNWTLTTNNQEAVATIGDGTYSYTASFNTPSITITTKEGKTYVASFNCYTIRNARQKDSYTNPTTQTNGSKGYLYDNGATLLLAINTSQPTDFSYYFCLMTTDEIEKLNNWYQNPNKDISIGASVSRKNKSNYTYYIYNPFTRRYATGNFSNDDGIAFYTTSVKPLYPFQLGYHSSTKDGTGFGYFLSQTGSGEDVYEIATDITSDNFVDNRDSLYYVPTNSTNISLAKNTNFNDQILYYRKKTEGIGFYLKSWNAYGGISNTCYGIATWGYDSGSLWVFDEVNVENPYTYTYQEPSETIKHIAYSLTYKINKVSAMVVNNKISRYYEFDKYYYLDEDITIDGNLYKKGNVIRFEYNAYKGSSYQANIVYYEVVFEYEKADGTKGTIVDPKELSFIYYTSKNNGFSSKIKYFNCTQNDFLAYKQGFEITLGDNTTIEETYPNIHWIYTTDTFNEIKYKLYLDDFGMNKADTFEITDTYYEPTYKEATIFKDTFDSRKNISLFIDENGNNFDSDYDYSSSTNYYEIGRVSIEDNNSLYKTQNIGTDSNPLDSIFNIFDYYKFEIYDSKGTKIPLNAKYNEGFTYYFKHGDIYTTDLPTMYHTGDATNKELILNAVTFEYFKNSLWYKLNGVFYQVNEDSVFNSDIQYYKEAYIISNFRQEILDEYNSILFINNEGISVGNDATFNPDRTYWTYNFILIENMNQEIFDTYKSVLYLDSNGTPVADDAEFDETIKYYKKEMIESKPGPKNSAEENWKDETSITRFYSHVKNMTSFVDKENTIREITRYKNDVTDIDNSTYSKIHQYMGSDSESENIYASPTINFQYELVLPGLISESNWDTYKNVIYYKSGNNYIPCSDKTWVDAYKYITFYRYILKSQENITASNVSYEHLAGYRLGKSSNNIFAIENENVLIWKDKTPGVNNTGYTMDEILIEANKAFSTNSYNEYYGKYYAYNGFTMGTELDTTTNPIVKDISGNISNAYQKGYVYRLVENPNCNGFMWKEVSIYYRKAGDKMVSEASTGEASVGDIIFATSECFSSFYTAGKFYRIVNDDFTKTLNVIQFTDVTISNSDKITDIQSNKIHYIYQSDYLGYAGTYEIVISAVIRKANGDGSYTNSIKKYKIKFVGTVIR